MRLYKRIITYSLVLIVGSMSAAKGVHAHGIYADNNFARQLAIRFNLNESEVRTFISEYNTDPEKATKTPQKTGHLTFIEDKLTVAVEKGKITAEQKQATMAKIKEMMNKESRFAANRTLTAGEKTNRINTWRKEMNEWASNHGLTMNKLRSITGKGNKYLMGVNY